ncbi:hypothetical protein SAMN06265379_101958 [Saccharicrinis carchari]|uniref:Uncharacterized protein n=1 Tax=Saccharicrinis carchari TaxID=1168039 RepID=A0A521BI54_SACCC|nr:hypothetical protein [Saccharicrinis carchari]SMO46814.1 hypothetical protein SAMN06265379_101958 [Saccharicrinis carchari]
MNLNKLYKEAEKIVAFKNLFPYFILLFIIGAVLVFSKIINSEMSNQDFFEAELNGLVNEIDLKPKNNYFQIKSKWYLIKDESIVFISKGDSLSKPKNSYMLIIYDKQQNIKWKGEVKNLIFKQVSMPGE